MMYHFELLEDQSKPIGWMMVTMAQTFGEVLVSLDAAIAKQYAGRNVIGILRNVNG